MKDPTLQRIWDAREAISRECDYDSRKLVRFYMDWQKKHDAKNKRKQQASGYQKPVADRADDPDRSD